LVSGEAPGLRDLGLLESALYRPRTGYYTDIAEMATALFQSLLMNHAFVDGNKRVAFFATDVFLRLNGWRLDVDAKEAHAFVVSCLQRNASDYSHLLVWIRGAMRKISRTI
jgi:death-on-curing protein